MAAARAGLVAKKITPAAIKRSKFLRWAFDPTICGIDGDKVFASIRAYIGERSLWEIYVDEGIARERDPHQEHTPSTATPEEQVQIEISGVVEQLKVARSHILVLTSTGMWEKVPKRERFSFLEDAIPAVKNFALYTQWSPAELAAIHRDLVSITTALSGGKHGAHS